MDTLRQAGGAVGVLTLLVLSLWWLKRKGVAQPIWRGLAPARRRLESIERLPLTAHHTLHLVRVGGRELLIASSPSGCSLVQLEGADTPSASARSAA